MKLLILLLAFGFAGAGPITDNNVCERHSRPWQVYLHAEGASSCSGALINEWWLVTSFLCAHTYDSRTIASLGEHNTLEEEGTEQHIGVAAVVLRSPYRSPLHSLALVRLQKPARFTRYVQPIPLPTRCPQPGETCQTSGWGSTIPSQQVGNLQDLKCLTVPVVDDQTCRESLPEYVYWGQTMFCAGQKNSYCMRDGGSVLECGGQVQGLLWYGHSCPADLTVYTKLCRYTDWISGVMSDYTPPTVLPTTTGLP
ncbi:trypsinogen-like protein 3 [Genypterus blacodes]|uniref:trypsinogen-like protein 3 n=1 Tax=Genypterus blacodes TaxID=154954 RepID=UPI003F76E83A